MITKTKPLIAASTNLAALNLDDMSVRNILGDHHWLTQDDGKTFVFVCHPRHWKPAATYLESKGAAVAPSLNHPTAQVGEAFASIVAAGVLATDTSWVAAEKMFQAWGWPMIDPVEL